MKIFRKYGIIALMIIVSGFSVFLPLYIWPKEIVNEFDAVMINEEASYSEMVSVKIDGHMNRKLFGGTRFTGKIKLEGSDLPEDYQSQNIQIKFGSDGIGVLKYLDESGEKLRLVEKGYISMPMNASYIVVSLIEGEDVEQADISVGVFIAGPSSKREHIIVLVNEKFKKILEQPLK